MGDGVLFVGTDGGCSPNTTTTSRARRLAEKLADVKQSIPAVYIIRLKYNTNFCDHRRVDSKPAKKRGETTCKFEVQRNARESVLLGQRRGSHPALTGWNYEKLRCERRTMAPTAMLARARATVSREVSHAVQ